MIVVIVIVIVIVIVVTGGKQSQLLASALGLGWSLTKIYYFTKLTVYYSAGLTL